MEDQTRIIILIIRAKNISDLINKYKSQIFNIALEYNTKLRSLSGPGN